jgi:N-acetylglucosaminyldiphosphoundecaprenol N-acetyl-beta-D-mannosaminyltransferase
MGLPEKGTDVSARSAQDKHIVHFLGLNFCNLTLAEAAELLIDDAAANIRSLTCFVNAHCFNVTHRDPRYAGILSQVDYLFADGIGVALAARLWNVRLRDNVNGTDLFPLLCAGAAKRGIPVAMLGGRPGIAGRCAQRMRAACPGLDIVLTRHGYHQPEEEARIIEEINRSGARILLVAKGVPAQERWIADHAAALATPVVLGVGALFDFYSDAMPRAPRSWRRLHLEWLFRLLMEPQRMFGRYVIGNPLFVMRALRCRLHDRGTPMKRPPIDGT